MLVFSITDHNSYRTIQPLYQHVRRIHPSGNIPIILVSVFVSYVVFKERRVNFIAESVLQSFPPDINRAQHLATHPNPSNLIYSVICNRLQVGNKSDLLRARQVPADEGETLAASLGGASSSSSPFILFFRNILLVFRYFLLLFVSLHILHICIKPPAESSMKLTAGINSKPKISD